MEKKKELILHIGRAKTGTSTLQHYLTQQRERLAYQGICYPSTGCNGRVAQHAIARACHDFRPFNPSLRRLRTAFEDEAQPFDRIVVSSEAFQNLLTTQNLHFFVGGSRTGALTSLLHWVLPSMPQRPYRIKVVCYIREYLEQASSSYAQKVHETNFVGNLQTYWGRHFGRPLSSFVHLWHRFGDDALFRYYEKKRLLDHDIVADFFECAGLTLPAPTTSHDANPSLSGNLLAFKLLVNQHGCHSLALYNAFTRLARLDQRYRGRIFVSDALAANLRAEDRGYNAQLSGLVGEIEHHSFESGNPFDPAMWRLDMERFLEEPTLAFLKDRPEIYRASASDIAALLRG